MTAKRSGRKRPSMFEVAKLAGVSHQTVSRVINDSPDVSDATRTKVQDAIKALDYRPSNSARALASHRSRTIGLIAGGMKFYGPISAISAIWRRPFVARTAPWSPTATALAMSISTA